MTTVVFPGGSGPFTVEDLERIPDDGRRHELLDGTLLVSPVPGTRHQKVVGGLAIGLGRVCPADMHVLLGPFAVRPADDTELRPDLLVARDVDLTEEMLPTAPVLAVEVLSPNTVLIDQHLKKAAYQRMGARSYWTVDPETARLTAFELGDDGTYAEVATVQGEGVFETEVPFPVRIVPAELWGHAGVVTNG